MRHEQESSLSRATSALRGPKRANLALHTVRMRFRRAGSSSGSPPHGTGAPRGQTQAGMAPDPDRDAVSDLDPDPDPSLAPTVWSLTPVHSPFSTGMLFQTKRQLLLALVLWPHTHTPRKKWTQMCRWRERVHEPRHVESKDDDDVDDKSLCSPRERGEAGGQGGDQKAQSESRELSVRSPVLSLLRLMLMCDIPLLSLSPSLSLSLSIRDSCCSRQSFS